MTAALNFEELFVGGAQAHGRYQVEPKFVETVRKPAPPAAYREHLAGGVGLGLVPIRTDGTCRFAAIDIDVDTIDHKKLRAEVVKRRMPLAVCRSKSGGAHLYLFVKEPGIAAAKVIPLLKKWALLLGHPGVEVFPKQTKITMEDCGNWINLPYHGAERTTRYAVGDRGSLSLKEFLASIEFYDLAHCDADETSPPAKPQAVEPAALEKQVADCGLITEGRRDNWLTSFAGLLRQRGLDEEDIRTTLLASNKKRCVPPLPDNDIARIAKSVGRYPEGTGDGEFDAVVLSNLRKYITDPPYYLLAIDGRDVKLTARELRKHPEFCDRVLEMLDLVLAPRRLKSWSMEVKKLLATKEDIELPPEQSSLENQVLDLLGEFLKLRQGARSWEDINKGMPYEEKNVVYFRTRDLVRHLEHRRLRITPQQLITILHGHGLGSQKHDIKGRQVEVWGFNSERINEQTEPFGPPVVDKEESEI